MPMNLIIQNRRRELGLTQEQVAEALNVSTPAVSKWETGATSPDISLLAPLARLLKIDLNTLFDFHEDLTNQEISRFCQRLLEEAQAHGLSASFALAEERLRDYPNDEKLLHALCIQLDGSLMMSGLSEEETEPYNRKILAWYRRLSESGNEEIRNSAQYMLAGRCIRRGELEKAQELLDRMPDRDELFRSVADKLMLQVTLWQRQGKPEKAAEALEQTLLLTLSKVQLLLNKLMDAELDCGEEAAAEAIAEKSARTAELFELWELNAYLAPLQLAFAEKDAEKCIAVLRKMLAVLNRPWEPEKSPLFRRIKAKAPQTEEMRRTILDAAGQEPLLRDSPALKDLLAEYEGKDSSFSIGE